MLVELIEDIKKVELIRSGVRRKKILLTSKDGMYECLESVQEFFNRQGIRQFNADTPYAKEMIEKMKSIGLDIN